MTGTVAAEVSPGFVVWVEDRLERGGPNPSSDVHQYLLPQGPRHTQQLPKRPPPLLVDDDDDELKLLDECANRAGAQPPTGQTPQPRRTLSQQIQIPIRHSKPPARTPLTPGAAA